MDILKPRDDIEVEAWWDPTREMIHVKVVRRTEKGKAGVKFKTTLDALWVTGEGMEFPHVFTYHRGETRTDNL